MKTIYIHIGTYKTATSSIQYVLGQGHGLREEGVNYPRAGRHKILQKHLRLYDAIIDDSCNAARRKQIDYEAVKQNLINEIERSKQTIFVISEEELSYPDPVIPQKLQFLRKLGQVKILFVVRTQTTFLDSLYRQFVKEDARSVLCGFDEFCDDSLVRRRADFIEIAGNWEAVFGEGNVKVTDFNNFLEKRNVVAGFFEWAEIPFKIIPEPHRFNESITAAEAEAVRMLLRANPRLTRMPIVKFFKAHPLNLMSTYLTQERCARIKNEYIDSNKRLLEKYGVDFTENFDCGVYMEQSVHESRLSEDALEEMALFAAEAQSTIEKLRAWAAEL